MVDFERWTNLADRRPAISTAVIDVSQSGADEVVPRVLVIDDDPEIHRLLRARLEARGYSVHSAESGEEDRKSVV